MTVTERFEIPPEMRAFAEKSVEQARQAFDGFISAAHRAVSAFEGQAETARKGAQDVTEKAIVFAQNNIATSFDFAQRLVQARNVEDVLNSASGLHQDPDAGADRAGQAAQRKHHQGGPGRHQVQTLTTAWPNCCPARRSYPRVVEENMAIVQCNIFYCAAPQPMLYCAH